MLLEHDCCTSRSIGYYLEPLAILGMFGKKVGFFRVALGGQVSGNSFHSPAVYAFRKSPQYMKKKFLMFSALFQLSTL